MSPFLLSFATRIYSMILFDNHSSVSALTGLTLIARRAGWERSQYWCMRSINRRGYSYSSPRGGDMFRRFRFSVLAAFVVAILLFTTAHDGEDLQAHDPAHSDSHAAICADADN